MRDFFTPGRSTLYAPNAAIATSHPLSTAAGLEILRAGGNAVDAAIAAVAVQSVVDPLMTGIGGDCFALYVPNGARVPVALDGSGRAPAAASAHWYRERNLTIEPTSAHAVTVPGAIGAWAALAADHGTRGLGDLLQPAIRYAEDGYPVQPRVAWDWARSAGRLRGDADAAAVFLVDGDAPAVGATMRNPKLGASLRAIAAGGARAFYQGEIAQDIVAKLNSMGGLHTLDDFAEAKPDYVTPITTRYRGFDVYECPPSGQGLAALMMLNMLRHDDIGGLDEVGRVHLFAEVCKIAYHHRDAHFADMAVHDMPVDYLLSDPWRDASRKAVDVAKAGAPKLFAKPEHADTVYLCVVDRDGNAISLINSIFQGFGSGIMGPRSGVLLHNRGISFRTDPAHPNAIAPRKRPMHTIIPGMLMRDGKAVAPFGVMGGHYQAMGHVELLTGLLDRGLDVQAALDAPRSFAHDGVLQMEPRFRPGTPEALRAMGHTIVAADAPLGGGQIIWIDRDKGVLAGGSDFRKDGRKDSVAFGVLISGRMASPPNRHPLRLSRTAARCSCDDGTVRRCSGGEASISAPAAACEVVQPFIEYVNL